MKNGRNGGVEVGCIPLAVEKARTHLEMVFLRDGEEGDFDAVKVNEKYS